MKQKEQIKKLIFDGEIEAKYYMETKQGLPFIFYINKFDNPGFVNGAISSELTLLIYTSRIKTLKSIYYTLSKHGVDVDFEIKEEVIDGLTYYYIEKMKYVNMNWAGFENYKRRLFSLFKKTEDVEILLLQEIED